ncbi:MAG: glycerol-3-phosphate 1-O-acyltransferase PlsY [Gammaproteobacteria bacterium]|nr:MAG: glycerol-3-phosphate 1-O-acyltransferase PlsY [Gammaproteobacteria bacterium]
MELYLLPLLAYITGSISTAILLAKALGLQDPREVGSGNPGATNILRYGGKGVAVATLLGDMLKGLVPVLIARVFTNDPMMLALVMLAAFLGHLYPLFFGFRGGKGVATALGVLLGINPWVGLCVLGSWLLTFMISRISSLSGLVASALAPVFVWYFTREPWLIGVTVVISAWLFWRHRSNIRKLVAGEEAKS